MAVYWQVVEYHDVQTPDSTKICPAFPIFVENVWLATRIVDNEEVHVITVDYKRFEYV